jgi:hypothetical protein
MSKINFFDKPPTTRASIDKEELFKGDRIEKEIEFSHSFGSYQPKGKVMKSVNGHVHVQLRVQHKDVVFGFSGPHIEIERGQEEAEHLFTSLSNDQCDIKLTYFEASHGGCPIPSKVKSAFGNEKDLQKVIQLANSDFQTDAHCILLEVRSEVRSPNNRWLPIFLKAVDVPQVMEDEKGTPLHNEKLYKECCDAIEFLNDQFAMEVMDAIE